MGHPVDDQSGDQAEVATRVRRPRAGELETLARRGRRPWSDQVAVGMTTVRLEGEPLRGHLLGMWVDPAARRQGVAGRSSSAPGWAGHRQPGRPAHGGSGRS